jgi:hypothetical protein
MSAAESPTPKSLTTVKEVGFSFNSPIFIGFKVGLVGKLFLNYLIHLFFIGFKMLLVGKSFF